MTDFKASRGGFPLNTLLLGEGLRARLGRATVGSGLVKVASAVLSLVVAVTLARLLGPDGYGVYSYVFALVGIITLPAQFGLPDLLVRETARSHSASDWAALKGVWRWGCLIALAASIVVAVAGAAALWPVAHRFDDLQLETFVWGLALVPMLVMVRLCGGAIRGLQYVAAGEFPDAVLRPGLLLILVVVLWLGGGTDLAADRAMALHVVATTLAAVVGLIFWFRIRPPQLEFFHPRYEHKAWARATIPLALTGGLMVVNRQADIILLGLFVEASEIGVYRVAVQAATLVAFGLQTVNLVAAPHVARMHYAGDYRRLQRLATACARVSLIIAIPLAVAFILFGQWLLGIFVGPDYAVGWAPLVILTLGQLANAGMGSVGLLLNMTHNESVVTRTVALAAVGNVVANIALIPIFGMSGAATATAVTFLVWNVLLARAVKARLGVNSTAFVGRTTA